MQQYKVNKKEQIKFKTVPIITTSNIIKVLCRGYIFDKNTRVYNFNEIDSTSQCKYLINCALLR